MCADAGWRSGAQRCLCSRRGGGQGAKIPSMHSLRGAPRLHASACAHLHANLKVTCCPRTADVLSPNTSLPACQQRVVSIGSPLPIGCVVSFSIRSLICHVSLICRPPITNLPTRPPCSAWPALRMWWGGITATLATAAGCRVSTAPPR
jgi:hypothetical protein